jgi:hypothetical protein
VMSGTGAERNPPRPTSTRATDREGEGKAEVRKKKGVVAGNIEGGMYVCGVSSYLPALPELT